MECTPVLQKLTEDVLRLFNPSREESEILSWVRKFLLSSGIALESEIESDISWGLSFAKEYPVPVTESEGLFLGADTKRRKGVLLAAHLDSDHIPSSEATMESIEFFFDDQSNTLRWKGEEVGLDDKTGIISVLYCLSLLHERSLEFPESTKDRNYVMLPVHVVFTVSEEIGQHGMLRLPKNILSKILSSCEFGVVVDRMSSRFPESSHPVRHSVSKYFGVELVLPQHRPRFFSLLGQAFDTSRREEGRESEGEEAVILPDCESEFCSDAIEWRGRMDAEIIAPLFYDLLKAEVSETVEPRNGAGGLLPKIEALGAVLREYGEAKQEVTERMTSNQYCPFRSPPRSTRYKKMQRIFQILYGEDLFSDASTLSGKELAFSVVNLSLDYDEDISAISLNELEDTALGLMRFIGLLVRDKEAD